MPRSLHRSRMRGRSLWSNLRASRPRGSGWRPRAAGHTARSPGASLHELLEAPGVEIPALSGTSAGAINAVVYADGWMRRPDATRAGMRRTRWQGSGGSTRPPRPHSRWARCGRCRGTRCARPDAQAPPAILGPGPGGPGVLAVRDVRRRPWQPAGPPPGARLRARRHTAARPGGAARVPHRDRRLDLRGGRVRQPRTHLERGAGLGLPADADARGRGEGPCDVGRRLQRQPRALAAGVAVSTFEPQAGLSGRRGGSGQGRVRREHACNYLFSFLPYPLPARGSQSYIRFAPPPDRSRRSGCVSSSPSSSASRP